MNEVQTIALEATYKDGVSGGYQKTVDGILSSSQKARAGLEELSKGFKGTEDAAKKAQDSQRVLAQVQLEAAQLRVRATKSGFEQERALAHLENQRRLAEFKGNNSLLLAEQERFQAQMTLIAKKEADARAHVQATEAAKAKEKSFLGQAGSKVGAAVAGGVVAAAGFFALSQAQQFLSSSLGSARESIAVQTELASTLKSTGFAAGVTQEQLNAQSDALQRVTRFSDETIGRSQAMLLTFTKIGKDVLPQATETTLDLAQKFGGDATQAAVMLGKALQDPIQGITALQRVGVQLSQSEEKQIRQFMRVGDIASAQKVILGELGTQVGGLARAMGDQDPFTRFENALDGIKETLGGAVLPILADSAEKAAKFINAFQDADGVIDFFRRLRAEAGKDFSKNLPNAEALRASLGAYKAAKAEIDRLADNRAQNAFAFQMGGQNEAAWRQLARAEAQIHKIAGDDKAEAFIKNIDQALKDLTGTVTTLEERQKKQLNQKPVVEVDPAVQKALEEAKRKKKAQEEAFASNAAGGDFAEAKAAIEAAKLQDKIRRDNEASDAEYAQYKTQLLNSISPLGQSRLEQDLAANKDYYAQLRKEAEDNLSEEEGRQQALTAIQKAEGEKRRAIETQFAQSQLASVTSNLQTMAQRWKVFGTAYKVFAQAQNLVDTYAGATAAYRSLAGVPIVGHVLGVAAAAAAVGAGLARAAVINAQKFAEGGIVQGASAAGDRVPIYANAGEMLLNKTQQSRLFSLLNGGIAGGMTQRNSWQVTYNPVYNFNGGGGAGADLMGMLRRQPTVFGDYISDLMQRGYVRMAA